MSEQERIIIETVECEKAAFIEASHQISKNPELQNQEFFASRLLTELLEKRGFWVKRDIAGHKTGFIAEFGGDKPGPAIAFLAEYDALPDIGHGCGHNIIGALSALAAVSLAAVMGQTGGTVFVYGTPAEEGGDNGSAKASFVDQGFFDGIDAALLLHPGCRNDLTGPSLAVKCYAFSFFGKTAHASACPEDGINALDAMILFYNGINALRQQCPSDARIHGIITDGGTAPNVIPDFTKAKFYVRSSTKERADILLEKVVKIAEGAALATGCTYKAEKFNNDVDDTVTNDAFDRLFQQNAAKVGMEYTLPEQKAKGSSDVGNVSHAVPVIQPGLKVSETEIPGHTVEFRDACISTLADESLASGAKALALTAYTLLVDPQKLEEMKGLHRTGRDQKRALANKH